jgi:hypothetical protein
MTDGRISQLTVRSIAEGNDARLSMLAVRTTYNFPSEASRISQLTVRSLTVPAPDARISQLMVRAVVRGRIANPTIRAWTFSLDGHDFYVLRLGDDITYVYDMYSEQWMEWGEQDTPLLGLSCGQNWIGGNGLAQNYGSNIVVGDDNYGLLWFLDPEQPYDQHPTPENPVQTIYFNRMVMGQVVLTSRNVQPCYAVWLTTDMGDPAYDGAEVNLSISDDAGVTFDDMGNIVVNMGADYPELSWYSLGQITAPGRLFKITDDGAITRIDGLEMNDDR